jgi:hypothetical protein
MRIGKKTKTGEKNPIYRREIFEKPFYLNLNTNRSKNWKPLQKTGFSVKFIGISGDSTGLVCAGLPVF